MRLREGSLGMWALLGALGLTAACGDDDDDDCSHGIPSCAVGFDYYNEKTCQCERLPDAGSDSATR